MGGVQISPRGSVLKREEVDGSEFQVKNWAIETLTPKTDFQIFPASKRLLVETIYTTFLNYLKTTYGQK